ncbi:MAG: nitric oxide reductase [Flavobacteriaceae bacterium]|mgnify:CR=1 FL=1|nr:nitric oxide reductase [Flavobacteriaceae bacterium]
MIQTQPLQKTSVYYPPGGILLWIIIFLELFTFAFALILMAINASETPELFYDSNAKLNTIYGTINTVFLLFSGWTMARSVSFLKKGEPLKSQLYLQLTLVGGLLFLLVKGIEYYEKLEMGLTLGYNLFFTYYWMLTLFHVIHVVVGLVILYILGRQFSTSPHSLKTEDLEAGAAFWHMCDLIWLLLFPVLYLLF